LLDNDNRAQNLIEEADLIVNTTPVGMKTKNEEIYCHLERISGDLLTRNQLFTI